MSVHLPAWNNAAQTGSNFMTFDICKFLENLLRKFMFRGKRTRITGTSHEYQYTFLIKCLLEVLRKKSVSDKLCRQNKTHVLCSIRFLFFENRGFHEITLKYTGCNRRNGPDFGRVFLMLNYTEKPPKHLYPKLNGLGDNGQ